MSDIYLLLIISFRQEIFCKCLSGQVRSECLMSTFRASCCSAHLSRAQVSAFASSSVRDRSKCLFKNILLILALTVWWCLLLKLKDRVYDD